MNESARMFPPAISPWPRRLAMATLVAAVPLVFFGGTVTTLHAGLAIDGWLVLEPGRGDHFLWLYPIDKWFRDVGTFVEHTHRLLGSLVGLFAIATAVATWATDRRWAPRVLSLSALLAVALQGTIGGLRVLEKSEDLAFLHGAIAQAVFALLGASCVAASPVFAAVGLGGGSASELRFARWRGLALAAVGAVYLQIVAGAWLRHGGSATALALHGVLAVVVVVFAVLLAGQMRLCAQDLPHDLGGSARSTIHKLRHSLIALVALQLALGIGALVVVSLPHGIDSAGTLGSTGGSTGLGTALVPTLHVVGGAALLFVCVASAMWAHRLSPAGSRVPAPLSDPGLLSDGVGPRPGLEAAP